MQFVIIQYGLLISLNLRLVVRSLTTMYCIVGTLPDRSEQDLQVLDAILDQATELRERLSHVFREQAPCFDGVVAERFAPNKNVETQKRYIPRFQKPAKQAKVSRRLLIGPDEQQALHLKQHLLSQGHYVFVVCFLIAQISVKDHNNSDTGDQDATTGNEIGIYLCIQIAVNTNIVQII
jgi:hypothetical protein